MENERLIELISKQLTGSISSQESIELASLLNNNKDNKDLFENLKSIWVKSAHYKPDISSDIESLWERLNFKIHSEIPQTKQKHRWLPITWVRAAAVLAIGLAIGFYYFSTTYTGKEYATAKGQQLKILLPDGTTVKLGEMSCLTYDNDYNDISREIKLSGSGYFNVVKDSLKPFIIQNKNAQISVLGTSFFVDAYPTKEYVTVNVHSGKVSFLEKGSMKSILLTKGMKGIYRPLDNALTATTESGSDIRFVGKLQFNDALLSSILSQLHTSFGKKFLLTNERIGFCKFTGSFDSPTLNEVIEVLSASLNIQMIQQGEDYHVEGEGC
jgi:transmembrane sensor